MTSLLGKIDTLIVINVLCSWNVVLSVTHDDPNLFQQCWYFTYLLVKWRRRHFGSGLFLAKRSERPSPAWTRLFFCRASRTTFSRKPSQQLLHQSCGNHIRRRTRAGARASKSTSKSSQVEVGRGRGRWRGRDDGESSGGGGGGAPPPSPRERRPLTGEAIVLPPPPVIF